MNRAGEMINNLSGQSSYQSFKPSPLPPSPSVDINYVMVNKLIRANSELAKLNMVAELIPNPELYISMYVRKEALISSQIEGTQCTLDDILDPSIDKNANLDVGDVINYISACSFALGRLKELPLSCRLVREIHEKMMWGVRGQEKTPGEFRRSQNWIGPAGCTIKDARYIPPNVEDMTQAMSDLEKYINIEDELNPLVRAALIHYQFETVHPFLDGNGRIGRMLILLYLLEQGVLSKPIIYVSYFLKKNQMEYYDRMSEVRRSGNYEQWINFFLDAVAEAANDSIETIKELTDLHVRNVAVLPKSNRSNDSLRLVFDYVEEHPIIDIKKTANALSLSYNTVASAVNKLVELNILKETTNASRNRVFSYEDYVQILRKDT